MSDIITSENLLLVGTEDVIAGATAVESAEPRDLRMGLREVASGVELVFKAILAAEHWTLVFADPKSAKRSALISGDLKTVGAEEAVARVVDIVGLGIPEAHRQALARLRAARNGLEHAGLIGNDLAIRGTVGAAAHVLLETLRLAEQKSLAPHFAALPAELVHRLSASKTFVTERMKEVCAKFPKGFAQDECLSCGQLAVLIECGTTCLFCDRKEDAEAAADTFLEEVLGECPYEVAKDGGIWPRYRCVECEVEAMVGDGHDGLRCFNCDTRFASDALVQCSRCDQMTYAEDEGLGVCDECLSAMIDSS